MRRPPAPEPIRISAWPRDDVRYPGDGTTWGEAHVHGPDGSPAARLALGEYAVTLRDFPAGSVFSVQVSARHGVERYEQTFRFRATRDDDDVAHYTVGPGLVTARGRWGRRTHSGFEFGVVLMGAVPVAP